MFDQVFAFLGPVLGFAAEKYGPIGLVLAYLFLFVLPICSVLIEAVEAVAAYTANPNDDVKAAELRSKYDKLVRYLEFLPHVNLPLAPIFVKILDWARKIAGAIKSVLKKP